MYLLSPYSTNARSLLKPTSKIDTNVRPLLFTHTWKIHSLHSNNTHPSAKKQFLAQWWNTVVAFHNPRFIPTLLNLKNGPRVAGRVRIIEINGMFPCNVLRNRTFLRNLYFPDAIQNYMDESLRKTRLFQSFNDTQLSSSPLLNSLPRPHSVPHLLLLVQSVITWSNDSYVSQLFINIRLMVKLIKPNKYILSAQSPW